MLLAAVTLQRFRLFGLLLAQKHWLLVVSTAGYASALLFWMALLPVF